MKRPKIIIIRFYILVIIIGIISLGVAKKSFAFEQKEDLFEEFSDSFTADKKTNCANCAIH